MVGFGSARWHIDVLILTHVVDTVHEVVVEFHRRGLLITVRVIHLNVDRVAITHEGEALATLASWTIIVSHVSSLVVHVMMVAHDCIWVVFPLSAVVWSDSKVCVDTFHHLNATIFFDSFGLEAKSPFRIFPLAVVVFFIEIVVIQLQRVAVKAIESSFDACVV